MKQLEALHHPAELSALEQALRGTFRRGALKSAMRAYLALTLTAAAALMCTWHGGTPASILVLVWTAAAWDMISVARITWHLLRL